MEFTHHILEIEQYEKQGIRPATLIPRQGAEKWLVRDIPVGHKAEPAVEWGLVDRGEKVRIPLFPYLSHGNDPAIALAFSAELAVKVMTMAQVKYEVISMHIVYGSPVQEITNMPGVDEPLLRFWAGFGLHVKEKRHG